MTFATAQQRKNISPLFSSLLTGTILSLSMAMVAIAPPVMAQTGMDDNTTSPSSDPNFSPSGEPEQMNNNTLNSPNSQPNNSLDAPNNISQPSNTETFESPNSQINPASNIDVPPADSPNNMGNYNEPVQRLW